MKTYRTKITQLLFWLFGIFCIISCNDENEGFENIDSNPLNLQSTVNPIVLDIENPDEEIVAFIWDTAPDKSKEGSTLDDYLFRMDIAGNNFESSIPVSTIRDGIFYKNFTSRALNKIISEEWNINLGDEITLEVRVIASYSNPDKFIPPIVSTISVPIKTRELASSPLFLTGSATPAGNDIENPIGMTELQNGEIYNWRGTLIPGEFYFILTPGEEYPAYKRGEEDATIIFLPTETPEINSFSIEEEGIYNILVNLTTGRIWYEKVLYFDVCVVGSATAYGWSDYTAVMEWSPYYPHECSMTIELKAGELRFCQYNNTNWAFRPMYPGTYIIDPIQDVYYMKTDYKWQVSNDDAGTYHIILDTKNYQVKFNKLY